MTITVIKNPYKLDAMKSFSYQPKEQKKENSAFGISKGIGIVAPPAQAKMPEMSEIQDKIELTQKIRKEMDDNIEKNKKIDYAQRDLETPLGVKLIIGLVALAALTGACKLSHNLKCKFISR